MSGKTHYSRELIQLGYIAVISVALASTTITDASASASRADYLTTSGQLGVCLLPTEGNTPSSEASCGSDTQESSVDNFQSELSSAFRIDHQSPLQSTYPASNERRKYAE